MSLGSRIRNLRKIKKLRQKDIANYIGMGRSNFGHIEHDRVVPSSSDLKKIAEILGTTPNYLLDEQYSNEEQQLINDINLSDEEILKKYNFSYDNRKLTEDEMKDMIKYIRYLLSLRNN